MFWLLVKTILAAIISDCKAYWVKYFEATVIMGMAFVLFYCGILLFKSVYQKKFKDMKSFIPA